MIVTTDDLMKEFFHTINTQIEYYIYERYEYVDNEIIVYYRYLGENRENVFYVDLLDYITFIFNKLNK